VATSLVYATDIVNESEESNSVPVVETAVVDEDTDAGNNDEIITDLVDSSDATVDNEDTQEVEGIENFEDVEMVDVEEAVLEDNEESSIEMPVSYGKSFSSMSQSWRDISSNGLIVTAEDLL
jgi:hypothetical protein